MTAAKKLPKNKPPADAAPVSAPRGIKLPGGAATVSQAPGEIAAIRTAGANPFRDLGGSASPHFNSMVFRETLGTIFVPGNEQDDTDQRIAAGAAALAAFKPADEIEGMLAAQAVAMHFGAMECFRRAIIGEQSSEVASKLRKDGANLARGMTDMLEALERKRGKGPQVVRVERVVVHEGGQAIVGNIQAGTPVCGPVAVPPRAIGNEAPAPTLKDIAGLQPEVVNLKRSAEGEGCDGR
jgi:hypothetical protein